MVQMLPFDLLEIDEDIIPTDQQESEDDLQISSRLVRSAVTYNTDWTVETLYSQIAKGNINLDPKFQRREAWDEVRKSLLIESIICGFPIPNIVLAEEPNERGRYLVIDGKQRLWSIFSFFRGDFKLRGLRIRSDLNGKGLDDLRGSAAARDLQVLENSSIRTVVIRDWPDEEFLYAIFYRLNSGSLPLSSQELRKAIHGGVLLDYIDDFVTNSDIHKEVFGKTPDRRMRDIELVLRFVAFELFLDRYDGNLKRFLDMTVLHFRDNWATEQAVLDSILRRYETALTTGRQVFGADVFKKWNGRRFERRINRAVFDVIARYFADPQLSGPAVKRKDDLISAFKELCSQEEFKESIERTTKTPKATRTRLRLWGIRLSDILGMRLDTDLMRVE